MTTEIPCPRCNQPVDPQARHCGHCGVDLALAAVLAEHALALPEPAPAGVPMTPEALVPRLGDYLIEKGLLASVGLKRALNHQRTMAAKGKPMLIGQALLELGLINRAALEEAVTEQILQLQQALRQANRQLEQRVEERTADLQRALNKLTELNQLKSNFISNISHELRTPLTHLKGYLDILTDGSLGRLTDEQKEALAVLKRAEARLERLIDDLIQFSLAARGELSLRLDTCLVKELVTMAVSQSTHKARTNQVDLRVEISPGLPAVRADPEKIVWVLTHLLDNAIKFTPQGGLVVVEARERDSQVILAVNDTGIGIPADSLQEIFEPFHQLDGSVTRRYAGTGLGLSMVHRILEAHGVQPRVESVVGKGSRFEFYLPVLA
ncbi:MAG TPA: ATP-binding protein [Anaerolineales bacterium]|nr:ATP-binding protein [Anaerolineales bacterium]